MATFNRREFLKASTLAIAGGVTLSAAAQAPRAHAADSSVLGQVVDFAAGVPSASSLKNAGFLGAVRYVSKPRVGTESWMTGKPVTLKETQANAQLGLATASIYQYGRAETADWLQGSAGAAIHAPQAISIHRAAGGPTNRPIYVAIDDNPTLSQYNSLIRPYLSAFGLALSAGGYQLGVYGNYNTINWAIEDGIGQFFWMHDWGSGGKVHPQANIHQRSKNAQRKVGGVLCDVNDVLKQDWGQWEPKS